MLEESKFSGKEDFMGFMEFSKEKQQGIKPSFGKYSSVFTFATENLDSYLKELNVINKKVLTVTSSGDQLINLALLGANEIDCFDTNRLCYYYAKLKIASLLILTYEEFIKYFKYCDDSVLIGNVLYALSVSDNCYDYNLYNKVSSNLDKDVMLFFDEVYAAFKYDGFSIARSNLFHNISMASAIHDNTYLSSSENYYKARKQIKRLVEDNKIKFYHLDVLQLHKLEKKYDVVLLSNIYDYIPFSKKPNYVEYIKQHMGDILEDNAVVAVQYQYCGDKRMNRDGIIKNLAVNIDVITDNKYVISDDIKTLFNLNLSLIKVPTIYKRERESGDEDCIYVYKNKRKV